MEHAFGHWLAGFIDGEASFTITKRQHGFHCQFAIDLRADDEPILREIHRQVGFGNVFDSSRTRQGQRQPVMRWAVCSRADCLKLVELLTRFPLRAKKKADFAIWSEAVHVWASGDRHRFTHARRQEANQACWNRMAELRQALKAVRVYDASPRVIQHREPPELRLATVTDP